MRFAALVSALFVLAMPALAGAEKVRGSLEITGGRGVITIKGRGALLGRLDKGSLLITDLSPADQWSPRINGVPRGRLVSIRGKDITFYVPAGRYKIVARGEGVNLSARGAGVAMLNGEADPTGATGVYAVGDDAPQSIPVELTCVQFGPALGGGDG
jgi:hypothetical protein